MTDPTMRHQGWYKLMQPKTSKAPSKAALKRRAAAHIEWDRRADEAIEWAKKFA
jgi:hypothetical protein